jgi:peptide/nickel transport system ATP-binding protein
MPLLEVRDLSVEYHVADGVLRAVDGVSLDVEAGESFGLVGESGCGKTTTVRALLGILPGNARVARGAARLGGRDLMALGEDEMRGIRWKEVSIIFQSAMNALDPVYRIQDQIVEAIRLHEPVGRSDALRRARELFDLVGIDAKRLRHYPHQLSGGMRQRACIAMALALNPRLVVADEPTTALDVLVKDQILEQIEALQRDRHIAVIYVSHDISVIAETCSRVGVMYGGRLVERGPVGQVFGEPAHPYTMGLLNAFPTLTGAERLVSIPGYPPNLLDPPRGCGFAARCPFRDDVCLAVVPPLTDVAPGHAAACHFAGRAARFRELAALPATWQRSEVGAGP